MKNYWMPKKELGEMRLGGMQLGSPEPITLPATFVVTGQDPVGCMLFCSHNKNKNVGNSHSAQHETLTWLNQNEIIYKGRRWRLDGKPSVRTNWFTFTLDGVQWIKKSSP
tara:strand:+ start:367 stop:696 length:330 start_codon:yes stop_codon:yes gene_type:complete